MTRRIASYDPVPEISIRPEPWYDDAACRGASGDWISPPSNNRDRYRVKRLELAICRQCPVQDECLDFALAVGEQHGIWGGLFADERRALALLDQRTTVRLP